MSMNVRTLVFTLSIFTLAAHAQPPGISAFEEASSKLRAAEADLNKEYQLALKGLTPADVRNLRDAQAKWMAYRDAFCKAEYGLAGGGTQGPTLHLACLTRITRQWIADLQVDYQ
jgi:uncharacterized protein YecT (DUF1311 family)